MSYKGRLIEVTVESQFLVQIGGSFKVMFKIPFI